MKITYVTIVLIFCFYLRTILLLWYCCRRPLPVSRCLYLVRSLRAWSVSALRMLFWWVSHPIGTNIIKLFMCLLLCDFIHSPIISFGNRCPWEGPMTAKAQCWAMTDMYAFAACSPAQKTTMQHDKALTKHLQIHIVMGCLGGYGMRQDKVRQKKYDSTGQDKAWQIRHGKKGQAKPPFLIY